MEIYLSASGIKKKGHYSPTPHKNNINGNIKIPPGFKILIIDDDTDFLEALVYTLTQEKIDVVAAGSGYKALEVLEKDYFDLILLDLRMQGMDGVETFNRIKKIEAQPFVIIMTANLEDKQEEAVKRLNPFGFIRKPFDLNQLIPYIEQRVKEEIIGH